jgi:trehalose/maltose hydrolase-like predicted phosphorylase
MLMTNKNQYEVNFEGYITEEEGHREALLTLGNGYFAVRGALEFTPENKVHYPGLYLAGGYDRIESEVYGKVIENEDLVNWPNCLLMTFRIDEGAWFSVDEVKIKRFHRILNMHDGVLSTEIEFVDEYGNETRLLTERLVSMNNRHICALRWALTPLTWSGMVTVKTAIDGRVTNNLVDRYRLLNGKHLCAGREGTSGDDVLYLEVYTQQSHMCMAQAIRTSVTGCDEMLPVKRTIHNDPCYIEQLVTFRGQKSCEVTIEKVAAVYTSRDNGISEPVLDACRTARDCGSYRDIRAKHVVSWKHTWARADMDISSEEKIQKIVRLHIFHVLQTASQHTQDLDVGIPPRGLHGEAYRGHIMWDELFIFPFLNYRIPVLTRQFLLYRYRRLDMARELASNAGFSGAMYPWQSGSNGREESQNIHLNPVSSRWVEDNTYLQRHVNSAIVYNIYQYYQVTDDKEFMYYFGAEMIFEIARFWSSMCTYSTDRKRFEIHNIVGPDEYHTRYPGAQEPGINNNAYTNITAAWVLIRAQEIMEMLESARQQELKEKLHIDEKEIERWHKISTMMFVPFLADGIISQFEGYEQLKELDWSAYRKKYGENMRLDRILESEGDEVDKYKAGKQADVLMLFYLFSADELSDVLGHMGYNFDTSTIPATIEYYRHRVSHGSTLSRIVFSWVQARSHRARSWLEYQQALLSDINDIQGGTTAEGIHLAAMAGTLDIIQRCYTGLEARGDVLYLNPMLPDKIDRCKLRIRYRSHWLNIEISHNEMSIVFEEGWGNPIRIGIDGCEYSLNHKQVKSFILNR